MPIDLKNKEEMAQLQRSVRYNWERQGDFRLTRKVLIDIYRGQSSVFPESYANSKTTLVNLFQEFVKGHLMATAYRSPRWSVNARMAAGRGFDKRIQNFLNRYSEILDFTRLARQWAVDSAFGYAVAKVVNGVAPKGVYSLVAPRAYRLNPSHVILDQSASAPEESGFIADIYLVPIKTAKSYVGFRKEGREALTPWKGTDTFQTSSRDATSRTDAFSEDQTRLIDIYFPDSSVLVTWAAPSNAFSDIGSTEPLTIVPTKVNPYVFLRTLVTPDSLEEMSPLRALKGLHLLSNDLLWKAARQARQQQRNPIGQIGHEQDIDTLTNTPDGEVVLVNDLSKVDLYSLPGADPSVVAIANLAMTLFGQHGGNLGVTLGQTAGADTARQTEALISQISAAQQLDRTQFELFMGEIGKRLATLAFEDESLALEISERVPGTTFVVNNGWASPKDLPRQGGIDDYHFEIVPFSGALRTPQERLSQLQTASQQIIQWMVAKQQGMPVNLDAILESYAESFDLIPNLSEWFTGDEPTEVPQGQGQDKAYTSLAGPAEGSVVDYQGVGNKGGGSDLGFEAQQGGLSSVQGGTGGMAGGLSKLN